MKSLIVKYKKPESTTDFMAEYLDHHLPKAKQLEGLISSNYFVFDENDDTYMMFIGNFENEAALGKALNSSLGGELAQHAQSIATGGLAIYTANNNKV